MSQTIRAAIFYFASCRCAGIVLAMVAPVVFLTGCDEEIDDPKPMPVQKLSEFQTGPKSAKKDGKDKKENKDFNLSPQELHEKAVQQIKELQAKSAAKAAKNQKKSFSNLENKPKAGKKNGDSPFDDSVMYGGKNVHMVRALGEKSRKKNSQETLGIGESDNPSNVFQIKSTQKKSSSSTPDITAFSSKPGEKPKHVISAVPAKKKNIFQRMFSRDKEPPPLNATTGSMTNEMLKDVTDGAKRDPSKFIPASEDRKTTLLQDYKKRQLSNPGTASKDGNKMADTVDLGATPTPAPAGTPDAFAPPATPVSANNTNAAEEAATEAEVKAFVEEHYQTGLKSRDVVARDESYRYAALARREDAIPFLIEEIRRNNLLAEYAARCLAAIGRLTPEVEAALVQGLLNKDHLVRLGCADSLARLKSRRGAERICILIKTEKNYQARCAYAEALGLIGDRLALPVLKEKLADQGEIEFVKSRAALALARLGDMSGRTHLIRNLDSPMPAMQVLGLIGIAQLGDPMMAGYVNSALESPYEEVWTTAVSLFPKLGPAVALPILRQRLYGVSEPMRRRAALAMGFLGSDDGMPYIDKAVSEGALQERVMGCELIGSLKRADRVPLLVGRLQDPHTAVRQTAAVALAKLDAKDAIPALVEAARGLRAAQNLPPALRKGDAPDFNERLVMLSCARALRGETQPLELKTQPNFLDQSWPEVDRLLNDQQAELLKMHILIDVVSSDNRPAGAVIRLPSGKEVLFREGEMVAAGYKLREMNLESVDSGNDKKSTPASVLLMRGNDNFRLIKGGVSGGGNGVVKPKKGTQ
jgi:HEAT repeat protein